MTLTILLDLDGVLVDFTAGANAAHGRDGYVPTTWDFFTDDWGMTPDEFWKPTHDRAFWSALPWTDTGRDIMELCVDAVGEEQVYILTSGRGAGAAGGKAEWVHRELGWPWMNRLLIGHCKHLCAGPGRVLVDDADHNVEAFREYGGYAVLVPAPYNYMKASTENVVDWVRVGLRGYVEAMAHR